MSRCENVASWLASWNWTGILSLWKISLPSPSANASAVLAPRAAARVDAARAVIDRAVAENRVVYGVTTGFGKFADVVIPREKLADSSSSTSCGATRRARARRSRRPPCGPSCCSARTASRRASPASAGRRWSFSSRASRRESTPSFPEQGSVGASGDLAPLAHLALALVGEGEVEWKGKRLPSAEALRAAGLAPAVLEAKEGLALINGTQLTTAFGALALHRFLRLLKAADLVAALTLDALKGTDAAFDARIHAARPHPGQVDSARNLRALLADSPLRESHRDCGVVQDAYALRCIPQVHGTARDAAAHARRVIEIEMNAATDNPMVFAETGTLVSGGNFHAAPVALVCDLLTASAADMASLSERRTERLVNPALSGDLPAFLTRTAA